MSILDLTAVELGERLKSREISVAEALGAALDAAENDENNAYITVLRDGARERAQDVQDRLDAGELTSPIAGVPVAVKDNICTRGVPTTCASKMLADFVPPYSAHVIDRLTAVGAPVAGKLNMDEFAMGSTSETSYFGAVKNPWDAARSPGGSSGGAAAAVAGHTAYCAIGSDTGGSIRQPCSFCGATGIKPTYGAVSRYGLIAYASSLDQIGPVARDARDAAAMLDALTGRDDRDGTSVDSPAGRCFDALTGDIRGLRVGVPTEYFGAGLDPDVKDRVTAAIRQLEALGAHVGELSLPTAEYAVPAYYIIASAEASSNLSRYDGIKYGFRADNVKNIYELFVKSRSEGFGTEVKRRVMLGNFVLSSGYYDAYYKKATQVKSLIADDFDKAFDRYDIIVSPTAPATAPKLGESLGDPLKMYLGDVYTVSANLAGLPAASVPCGLDRSGLPVGMQLIGRRFSEPALLNAAYAYQQATGFHRLRPPEVSV